MWRTILAVLLLLACGIDVPPPEGDECREGEPSCLCDGIHGECRVWDPPVTCAECVTEEECNEMCDVGPCTKCNETGCWIPAHLSCEEN